MIRIERVSKVYKRESLSIPVLTDVRLEIAEGEFLALMGPSGSGKTTLLNLIAGLDRPTSGKITVGSRVVSDMKESELADWRSQNVGLVFQLYNLIPVFTALENVEFSLLLTKLSRKARLEHARAALSIVGLGDRMDHYPRQLSGGQEQRVAIARAIATDPVLLVADEPTGDLDAKSAQEVLDLLNRLNREFKKTIVMVTHDPRAAAHAHRIVHLDKGALSKGEMPKREVEALLGGSSPAPAPAPVSAALAAPAAPSSASSAASNLEARFLRRVVSAMADYATARSAPGPSGISALAASSAAEEDQVPPEAFEGLTAHDILQLTDRLETLFAQPAKAPGSGAPPAHVAARPAASAVVRHPAVPPASVSLRPPVVPPASVSLRPPAVPPAEPHPPAASLPPNVAYPGAPPGAPSHGAPYRAARNVPRPDAVSMLNDMLLEEDLPRPAGARTGTPEAPPPRRGGS